jgi:hypothetical protein
MNKQSTGGNAARDPQRCEPGNDGLEKRAMKIIRVIVWAVIAVAFGRGLFVLDMGPSAKDIYPTASGICLAGAVVASAIMYLADYRNRKESS